MVYINCDFSHKHFRQLYASIHTHVLSDYTNNTFGFGNNPTNKQTVRQSTRHSMSDNAGSSLFTFKINEDKKGNTVLTVHCVKF